MARRRVYTARPPAASGTREGLAYALWLPDEPPAGGVVVLHGAGSSKESHFDFARAGAAPGLATLCFDARGHGESGGAMDAAVLEDVVLMAELLREAIGDPDARLALRGSSLGGYLALVSAAAARADAVVAICPPSAVELARGLDQGRFEFAADAQGLRRFFETHELEALVPRLEIPILLLHAAGDEVVPVEHSRELAGHLSHPGSRLIVTPGGHHRSIQHDDEMQAVSLRFILRAFAGGLVAAEDPRDAPAGG